MQRETNPMNIKCPDELSLLVYKYMCYRILKLIELIKKAIESGITDQDHKKNLSLYGKNVKKVAMEFSKKYIRKTGE